MEFEDDYDSQMFPGCRNTPELLSLFRDFIPLNPDQYEVDYIKGTTNRWTGLFRCTIKDPDGVKSFLADYFNRNNESIKIRVQKKLTERSSYSLYQYYRCHHDTRHVPVKSTSKKELAPSRRMKNTNCSDFNMIVKIVKDAVQFPCSIQIDWAHNHPVQALEATSFKAISSETIETISGYFQSGDTAATAYQKHIAFIKNSSDSEIMFHRNKANRSLCPMRRDFNFLYRKFCTAQFGGKNGEKMFKELEDSIKELQESGSAKIAYQEFDSEQKEPLILAIVTPLMERVHEMVRFFLLLFYFLVKEFSG